MATEELESAHNEETANVLFSKRCCCCIPFFRPQRSRTAGLGLWENARAAENEERWWTRGFKAVKKVREWSELVAGPRWKTFIRRFNRTRSGGGGSRHGKYQYDPLSYTLNFDEGPGQNGYFDDDDDSRGFSARYAPVPVSAKTSVDFGREVPAFA
ncbi:hypothetical protein L1049_028397 [Liquidambar formosana]|uniref:NHL domain-containing protein n=1 Tax=Liquidambar formosana TaxID=63359 RepID=A0AAP0RKC3_LIQFO